MQQLCSQQSSPNRLACLSVNKALALIRLSKSVLDSSFSGSLVEVEGSYQLRAQSPANAKVHLLLETQLLLGWILVPEIPPSEKVLQGISGQLEETGTQVSPCGQPPQVETWSYTILKWKVSAD